MASRAERTLVGEWWWTVDRAILVAIAVLMVAGLVFLMGGGPPVAERLGLSTFHFVSRQIVYLAPAVALMVAVSFLPPRYVRRAALLVYLGGLAMMIAALYIGPEVKGSRRWLTLAGITLQPSEFVKPAFVVLTAWLFAEGSRRRDVPGTFLAMLILPVTIVPLILQPDIGQTMLISIVWGCLFFTAGLHIFWVAGIGGIGLFGLFVAYELIPHVRDRISRFMDKEAGDTFQVDTALEAFAQGGWLGKGPGEGTVKRILPDAHTDFIFAVTAEEFGILVCIALVCLFGFIVLRGLYLAQRNEEPFCRLAVTGLVTLFGIQASINMMVNVHLIPAKGMTLPFISYGGSSLLSLALGMGFLIALTRKRPRAEILDRITPTRQPVKRSYGSRTAQDV
ncbi:FtsW/RodA/SpoVE family cell cycle protein [Chelatococcus asaccharovorans]|uniref:Probable peptidoglycan glycosyltransferase FtsW n=1 Tax=Chelatococcus asaccharovorans TaxID=28210 RepID=A0A2V3U0T1_9HYPH|nr:putative peptidoglycan glycosyltransferase FtsW [Chelatococcus asaccharovorans]MBS7704310.1 cell division protein FtsW [Chelatococcus asaccharovorans]PXW55813.1 cell division protein FtsW [Chelatococcus asaccharovorans]CAH1664701.1 putative peptidoglycan glycosyltransferase FtsW [Chelatococcus asaccharovorans]CAH1682291.1 putative peptidoglycan glycosyltransferase FtsW [Chelatococcus asaccharovorans]